MLALVARRVRRAALIGGLAVAWVSFGAASASASWEAPRAIDNAGSGYGASNGQSAVAAGQDGLTTAMFFQVAPDTPSGSPGSAFMVRRAGGSSTSWGAPAEIAIPAGQASTPPQPVLAAATAGPVGSGGTIGLFGFQPSSGSAQVLAASWPSPAPAPAPAATTLCTSAATPECATTGTAPAQVAFDSAGTAYAVGAVLASGDVIVARTDPSTGAWQPAQLVGQGSFPEIAADPAGDVVVTYVRTDNTNPIAPVNRLFVRREAAGQTSFGSEFQISGGGSVAEANDPFTLLIDRSGTATAVFIEQPNPAVNAVEAVRWALGSTTPGSEQQLSGAPQSQGPQPENATAVVDSQGDVTAAWDSATPGDTVYAARLIGGTWTAAAQVSPNNNRSATRPQLAVDAAGTVTMVYTDSAPPTGSDIDVKATRLPLQGTWSTPTSLRSTDPAAGAVQNGSAHVAAAAAGQADVTFIQQLGSANRLLATRFDDTTPPGIEVVTPRDGAVYHQLTTVVADYSCSDEPGGSGVGSCAGTVPAGQAIDTSSPGAKTFTVTAADQAGNIASKIVHYTVAAGPTPTDRTPPRITLTVPRNGATYARGQRVDARFSCADPDSPVKLCRGTVANGHLLDTRSLGRHSFSVIAQDPAGNTDSKTVHYLVRPAPMGAVIHLTVVPRRVRARHRVRLRFRATACALGRCDGLADAVVSFDGQSKRTNSRGYATFNVILRSPGRHFAYARSPGYRTARTPVVARG